MFFLSETERTHLRDLLQAKAGLDERCIESDAHGGRLRICD